MPMDPELPDIVKRGCDSVFGSEREFRERVISRLLDSMGWTSDGDIQYEYGIPVATTNLRVDYLVGKENPFALEAKHPDVDISPGSSPWRQLSDYLRLDQRIRYGVLYNGKAMYIVPNGMDKPLVSWNHDSDYSAFGYLSKTAYPNLLDMKTEFSGHSFDKGTMSMQFTPRENFQGAVSNSEFLINRTVKRLKISLYSVGISLILLFLMGIVENLSQNNYAPYIGLSVFFALVFIVSSIASIIYYIEMKFLRRKLKRSTR